MPDAIYIVIRLSFHDFTPNLREQSCGGGYKKQEPSKISLSSFYLSESPRLPSCNCPSLVQLSLISILRKYMSEIELDVKNLVSGRVAFCGQLNTDSGARAVGAFSPPGTTRKLQQHVCSVRYLSP